MTYAGGVHSCFVKMAALDWIVCCLSEEQKLARVRSREIDKQLAREKLQYQRTQKILLLGSGESGKSTFLKQMRIIHGNDYQEEELLSFKSIIYSNILKGMKVLVDARDKLNIQWGDESNSPYATKVFNCDTNVRIDDLMFHDYVPALVALWQDRGVRTAFDRRREFQLVQAGMMGDSVKYFLDNMDRIGEKGYIPVKKDILHARKATKGIWESEFHIKGVPFRFVDVGGQRSQRQKWYQCFDSVTSILFLVSSSEFDQVLMEDRKTNRLVESASIFETIVNNKAFSNVSVILFLNKTDLLEEKIKDVSIKDYFPQFTGDPHRLEDVQKFELDLLDSRRRERSKPLFHHFTTAVDTENIKFVFQAVKDTILQHNLVSIMLQ